MDVSSVSSVLQYFEVVIIMNVSIATHSITELGFEPSPLGSKDDICFNRTHSITGPFSIMGRIVAARHFQGCREGCSLA